MQDTAEGFGQPIRNIFQSFFAIERELPTPFDAAPRYRIVDLRPHLAGPLPAGRRLRAAARRLPWRSLQQGRIAAYLLYSFATLVVLLALVLAT